MAVNVTLWAFSKRLNSTMRPASAGTALSGTIKEPCSMLTPEIMVDFDPTSYNYFRVTEWDRFYWITDVIHDRGLFIIRGRIDPLASWKDTIGNSFQYVLRSSSSCNGEIIDTFYPAKANGHTRNTTASMGYTNIGTYVIGIAGSGTSGSTGGGTVYYEMTPAQMNSFVQYLYTDTKYGVAGAALEETVKYYFNPLQYVVSCMWFPFSLGGDTAEYVKVGWWNLGISANRAYLFHTPGQVAISVPKHPLAGTDTAYLNAEPFSHYRLYVPGAGEITLNSNVMAQLSTLYINSVIDTITGRAFYEITDGTNILAKLDGQIGVPIALSQVTVNTIGAVMDTAQAGLAGLAAVATGGLSLFVAGGSIGNAIESNQPTISRTGADGCRSMAAANSDAILTLEYVLQVSDDNTDFGRPLCMRAQIRTLSGYISCLKPHIAIAGTAEESAEIERYLTEGVYYE